MSKELKRNSPATSEADDSDDDVGSNEVNHDLVIPSSLNGATDKHLTNEDSGHVQDIRYSDDDEQELKIEEVPLTPVLQEKARKIKEVLETTRDRERLIQFALSDGGLVTNEIRKKAWPILVEIDEPSGSELPSQAELENHQEYRQVKVDVDRSLKRFPRGIPVEQRTVLLDQLTRLILRVIIRYPHLRYYQGYHDVAVTFLLIVGESVAFKILEKLSNTRLKDLMEPSMDKTMYCLNYMFPLISRMNPLLFDYLERASIGAIFSLSWILTWYAYDLEELKYVVRLYDFFLVTPVLMPVYLAAKIVVHRQDEIFYVPCEESSLHPLLKKVPKTLPFDHLLQEARALYNEFPPESIQQEVDDRLERERSGVRQRQVPPRQVPPRQVPPPHRQNAFWRWWSSGAYRRRLTYFVVPTVTTLVVFYAMFKAADAYTFDLLTSIR